MKLLIKRFFSWVFKHELDLIYFMDKEIEKDKREIEFYKKQIESVMKNFDISVDVHDPSHRYSPSWAVISLQGNKTDYIKFVDLGEVEIREISSFLRKFDRRSNVKIDARPDIARMIKIKNS